MQPRRTLIKALAVSVIGLIALSSCASRADWLMFRGKDGRGYTSTSIQPPLAVKWELRLQYQEDAALSFNPPALYDRTLYFGSDDGNFYALDLESGYMRWVFKTDGPVNSVPAVNENLVFFGSNDGKFYCVSRESGMEMWSFDTGRRVQSSTVLYEDTVVFTSDIGATYVFDLNGVELFRIPNLAWLYHTFQVQDDVMYFAPGPESRPVSLGAYDLENRGYLWLLETANDNATWYSFPALKGDSLFYATAAYPTTMGDLTYYALDHRTGQVIWRQVDTSNLGNRVTMRPYRLFEKNLKLLDHLAPSLWKNLVIYTSGDTVVRAYNQKDGRPAWRREFDYPTSSSPTVASNRVYIGLHGDNLDGEIPASFPGYESPKLVSLSARTGKVLWELDIEGSLLSAPVIAGEWIVFGTDRNMFYVLEEVL